MRSSTAISRGSTTYQLLPSAMIAPQRWRLTLTTSRNVVANTEAFG